jgi:hypothetical protein
MNNYENAGNSLITIWNGRKVTAKAIGDIPITLYDSDGVIQMESYVSQVKLLPGSLYNLLSRVWIFEDR